MFDIELRINIVLKNLSELWATIDYFQAEKPFKISSKYLAGVLSMIKTMTYVLLFFLIIVIQRIVKTCQLAATKPHRGNT